MLIAGVLPLQIVPLRIVLLRKGGGHRARQTWL
jgi:hypothetical protein